MITGQICGGLIDYDEGYNSLVCTKCGAVYRASEIAKILKDKEIIVKANKERGNEKMRVGIIRGNNKVITMDTTNQGTGIIKPDVANITPSEPKVEEQNVPEEKFDQPKTIRINIRKAIESAENEKRSNTPAVKGKVTIKRTSVKKGKNYKGNNVNFNKSNESYGNNKDFKVKVSRGVQVNNKPAEEKKEQNNHRSTVNITAVSFDEINNTTFKFSSYDAENGLVFVNGTTPSGSNITVHFDCKDVNDIARKLGVDLVDDQPVDSPDMKDAELKEAQEYILKLEEKNINLDNKIKELENSGVFKGEEFEKEIAIKDASIKELESDLKNYMDMYEAEKKLNETISNDSDELESLKSQVENLTAQLQAKDLEMSKASASSEEITVKDEEISKLQEELEKKDRSIESLTLNLDSRDEQIVDLQNQLTETRRIVTNPERRMLDEKSGVLFVGAEFYPAVDLLTDEEQKEYTGPKDILPVTFSYTDQDEKGNDIIVSDFVRDGNEKVIAIDSINGITVDKLLINLSQNETEVQGE